MRRVGLAIGLSLLAVQSAAQDARLLLVVPVEPPARARGPADGWTALHAAAAATTDPAAIRALLAAGADPRARDATGATPLHAAAAADAPPAVLAALIAGGAPLEARDAEGATALRRAASARGAALLGLAGADVCAADAAGARALDFAMLEAVRIAAPPAYAPLLAALTACR